MRRVPDYPCGELFGAVQLATPEIIDESIRITLHALKKYRALRRSGAIDDMSTSEDVAERTALLVRSARTIIADPERHILLYTPEGLYLAFAAGFCPHRTCGTMARSIAVPSTGTPRHTGAARF